MILGAWPTAPFRRLHLTVGALIYLYLVKFKYDKRFGLHNHTLAMSLPVPVLQSTPNITTLSKQMLGFASLCPRLVRHSVVTHKFVFGDCIRVVYVPVSYKLCIICVKTVVQSS